MQVVRAVEGVKGMYANDEEGVYRDGLMKE